MESNSAYLTLLPISAVLSFGDSFSDQSSRHLYMDAKISTNEDVQLSSGHSLQNADWKINIHEAVSYNEFTNSEGAIGVMNYWSESQTCSLSVSLKPVKFNTLLSCIQKGFLPEKIIFLVKNLEYGSGETLVWDVESKKKLVILEYTIDIQIVKDNDIQLKLSDITDMSVRNKRPKNILFRLLGIN